MKQVIIFNNCEQNFALELERIERIIEYSKPKKLPETADYILGVIQYNEKVLPSLTWTEGYMEFLEKSEITVKSLWFSGREHIWDLWWMKSLEFDDTEGQSLGEELPSTGESENGILLPLLGTMLVLAGVFHLIRRKKEKIS